MPVKPPKMLYSAYERRLRGGLAPETLPRHVAVLADGNRRWARANAPDEPLVAGYRAGAAKLREFCDWCSELHIPLVTLWVLSTDNLERSDEELGPLCEVISHLVEDLAARYPVRLVGALEFLPDNTAERLRRAETLSNQASPMHVNVAVAYGGRQELRDAVRSLLAEDAERGLTLADVAHTLEVDQIEAHLYTSGQPDPDLIIRTSGEQRLSGFLMWQSAHSEFYFCEALWPDFRRVDFYRALRDYAKRERRYGR
ncbi:MAG: polyprenyl diphosphate synthase [Propionibacteriaceae bacterium]|nr:polyprenyl diphosphate synthase [Propionibacteriaceae bacterium]